VKNSKILFTKSAIRIIIFLQSSILWYKEKGLTITIFKKMSLRVIMAEAMPAEAKYNG
jgi:hypothetical protein